MFVWLIIVFFVDGLWLPARTTWNLDDFQENRRYYLVKEPELENCSNRNLPTLSNKVIGGRVARKAQWPFIVNFDNNCGGSLLNTQWVLTAAHCCQEAVLGESFVVVGDFRLKRRDPGESKVMVDKIIMHPKFDGNHANDICLLRMETEELYLANRVQPACLPEDTVAPIQDSECFVAGWGYTNKEHVRRKSRILRNSD